MKIRKKLINIKHLLIITILSFFLIITPSAGGAGSAGRTKTKENEKARECKKLFIKYNISPEIKSQRGWKRVVKKKELYKYIIIDIQINDLKNLSNCLIDNGFNIEKYNRSIGKKL